MDAESKQRQRTVWQLALIAVVLVVGVLIIALPRRAEEPTDGAGQAKRTVTLSLSGEAIGPLMLSSRALSEQAGALVATATVPLAWSETQVYTVANAAFRANPALVYALDRMLLAYTGSNAIYAEPIVTQAYLPGDEVEQAYAGGYAIELSLSVPNGESMTTVPLSNQLAGAFRAWIASHAAYYGFALSGEGMLRYVGTPHAAYLFSQSVTLEEYVELVKTKTQKN